ncbi:MAG: tRNA lysidine(34) synthetase TilS [Alphaproteobacteria bacterium]|nr:tRNA lysidine(34) synthetase TilS [Alphaproteobacteria bacterium]
MNQKFMDFMRNFYGKKLAVAVSGGVDSVALLHWLVEIGADIVCLHVNHGLRAVADTESEYVRDLCKKLNVPCKIFRWMGDKPESGLEAAARAARYKMMTDFCHENEIEYLLTAHQADDQIETFLMNLGRGSGVFGLAAMQPVSERDGIKIVRPLLNVSREELKNYCDTRGIKYFVDEMNNDARYTRVRIRKNRHVLHDALGISDERILLAIENLNRARDAIATDIDKLVADVMGNGFAMFRDSFLFDLAHDIRLKFIGTLIQKIGGDDYQPRLNSLCLALNKLHGNCKFTLGHCTVRRLGERILIVPEGAKTTFRKRNGKNGKLKKQN